MVDKVAFLSELADLLEKHEVALCSKTEGDNYSSVCFISHQFSVSVEQERFYTGRSHSTPYELRLIANNYKRLEEANEKFV